MISLIVSGAICDCHLTSVYLQVDRSKPLRDGAQISSSTFQAESNGNGSENKNGTLSPLSSNWIGPIASNGLILSQQEQRTMKHVHGSPLSSSSFQTFQQEQRPPTERDVLIAINQPSKSFVLNQVSPDELDYYSFHRDDPLVVRMARVTFEFCWKVICDTAQIVKRTANTIIMRDVR